MNYRFIFNQLCALLMVLGTAMTVLEIIFFISQSFQGREVDLHARFATLIVGIVCAVVSAIGWKVSKREERHLGRRDALLLVALSWFVGAAVSAMPYLLWAYLSDNAADDHPFRNFVNCYFEAMSGLTTVGASILVDIEAVPRSLLLWRALTHWFGGIGIVVIFVAILPAVGVGAKRMFFSEVSGPLDEGVMPDIKSTARVLLGVYCLFTIVEILALWAAGMPLFDSVCNTFGTIATGGFSPNNASIGGYNSTVIDMIVTVFMIVGGVNFGLYILIARGELSMAFRNKEFQLYLAMLLGGAVLIALMLVGSDIRTTTGETVQGAGFFTSLRYSLFNVVSVQSTTGFATADYNLWPTMAQGVIFALLVVGGCAGSTAGGVKVIRIIILFKVLFSLLERAFRPNVVRAVKVNDVNLPEPVQLEVLGFAIGTVVVIASSSMLLMTFEPTGAIDVVTAVSGSAACFYTTGPGFGGVGPAANYAWLTDGSKITLCLSMVLGRLELIAVLALITPRFWRSS